MQPLTILLIILVLVAVWAVAEMAIFIRKARASIDEISRSATEAIDQATPIIAKLDGVVDELQPALKEVTPLVEKCNTTLEEANNSLSSLSGILGDVNAATHGVAGVGESATRIVNTATSAAVGVVSKVASLGGINIPEGQQLISKKSSVSDEDEVAESEPAHHEKKTSYVTYAAVTAPSSKQSKE